MHNKYNVLLLVKRCMTTMCTACQISLLTLQIQYIQYVDDEHTTQLYKLLAFRAKNSYSIERRPIDYVPTATLGSCCGRVPCCKSCKLKQSELKLNFVKFASGNESLLYQMHWKCLQRCITPLNSATTNTALFYQQAIHQRLAGQ
jgi:hypothetical protein